MPIEGRDIEEGRTRDTGKGRDDGNLGGRNDEIYRKVHCRLELEICLHTSAPAFKMALI